MQHFNNKRSYRRRSQHAKAKVAAELEEKREAEAAAQLKNKGKAVVRGGIDDIWYFGSDEENNNA
jgi:hypothetical protein